MPSFDVVSEVDLHEVRNACDQANREVSTRFDFKGTGATYTLTDNVITMQAQVDFQLQQMRDILHLKLAKRKVDIGCLDVGDVQRSGSDARQAITIRQGIATALARKLVKLIKQQKLKVQTAIQGDQLRVSGKKRDDLQAVIAVLREDDVDLPLQYNNFRD